MTKHQHIKISSLTDHPEAIPILTTWFYDEWHPLYPERTLQDITQYLENRASENKFPLTYVAINKMGEVVGTASLDEDDMDIRPDLSPWVANVYVKNNFRGQGIGVLLMKKILAQAKSLRFKVVYLYTLNKEPWYTGQGWKKLKNENYRKSLVSVMYYDL